MIILTYNILGWHGILGLICSLNGSWMKRQKHYLGNLDWHGNLGCHGNLYLWYSRLTWYLRANLLFGWKLNEKPKHYLGNLDWHGNLGWHGNLDLWCYSLFLGKIFD